jgi:hypothetical protein
MVPFEIDKAASMLQTKESFTGSLRSTAIKETKSDVQRQQTLQDEDENFYLPPEEEEEKEKELLEETESQKLIKLVDHIKSKMDIAIKSERTSTYFGVRYINISNLARRLSHSPDSITVIVMDTCREIIQG